MNSINPKTLLGFLSFLCLVLLSGPVLAAGNGRLKISVNEAWQFHKGEIPSFPGKASDVHWETVSLPHTWNAEDVMDDKPGYYRGVGWYRKILSISPFYKDKDVFLYFEGANQEVEVYVNGQKAGEHIGGYTRFTVPIKKFLKFGKGEQNEIAVKVNNRFNEDIPTLTADFTFFGGIYRDVFLVVTDPVHIDLTDYASSGIYITTPEVSEEKATVKIAGKLVNSSGKKRKIRFVTTLKDEQGKTVAEKAATLQLGAGARTTVHQEFKSVKQPHLWSPEDPYLYTLATIIYDAATGQELDQVASPLGFRWFRFDPKAGFFLNGKHYKLIGASRHQDFKGLGNAVPDARQVEDVKLLKAMGGNFLRVAHYPQDPVILEACDRLGILAAVEVPIINAITESVAFADNSKRTHLEMIRQNFNHPSVIIWAYMNEILLRPKYKDEPERQQVYFSNIAKLAQELEDLTRQEDPHRYTMIPNHGAYDLYNKVGLTKIPMLVGWNLYLGWYSRTLENFGEFLDQHHRDMPDKPVLVTEYGADADPRIHSFTPERFDKSEEYASRYHEVYLREMMKRPFVAAGMIWNLADFNSESRGETMPHINNKGVTTLDRIPKAPYHYYQAHLLKNPFLRMASRNWTLRGGIADRIEGTASTKPLATAQSNNAVSTQPFKVYTNLPQAELQVNGVKLGVQQAVEGVCEWQVPFKNGLNRIEAVALADGKEYKDFMEVNFRLVPDQLTGKEVPFEELNVLLGAKRLFIDELSQQVWLPDQPYRSGSWGHVGGESYTFKSNRQSYGTDKSIFGTDNDPIYQTQQVGIEKYRADVPDGQYEITLHFAELTGGQAKEVLPYNLGTGDEQEEKAEERIFDVHVNGVLVLEDLDLAQEYGVARAVAKKMPVTVSGNKGLEIVFTAKTGRPVLNGFQVRKL
ncbi:glycoside hydrolase family 2 TIM barrel-domain containing protein [Pontibacter beigongshangensis]|uniref:glycoside hydrolase family 2 TIM barrel-domain containing protein n=1 Tax=Pontibacter beigongshangensis TaxID=2574733 RepID=UPI00164F69CB|nr:glycoside hydrolase family 2 TIM barrel-domain containing protein [Pontibacter beigongshangensis]